MHTCIVYLFLCKLLVRCSFLTDPNDGTINCSLGDDGVPSYEDTCSFTCNTGYELTGSDTRTCQSNETWSGSDVLCRRGTTILYMVSLLVIAIVIQLQQILYSGLF